MIGYISFRSSLSGCNLDTIQVYRNVRQSGLLHLNLSGIILAKVQFEVLYAKLA